MVVGHDLDGEGGLASTVSAVTIIGAAEVGAGVGEYLRVGVGPAAQRGRSPAATLASRSGSGARSPTPRVEVARFDQMPPVREGGVIVQVGQVDRLVQVGVSEHLNAVGVRYPRLVHVLVLVNPARDRRPAGKVETGGWIRPARGVPPAEVDGGEVRARGVACGDQAGQGGDAVTPATFVVQQQVRRTGRGR